MYSERKVTTWNLRAAVDDSPPPRLECLSEVDYLGIELYHRFTWDMRELTRDATLSMTVYSNYSWSVNLTKNGYKIDIIR